MKKVLPLLVVLSLLAGCKPKQIIQDRTVYKVDSTAVTSLKSELQKKTIELQVAKVDLERARDENTRLMSEVSSHTINYDTGAPVDPTTGKHPMASETKTESKSIYEKTVRDYEKKVTDLTEIVEEVTDINTDLSSKVDKLTEENRDLKIKTTPTTGFNFRLFFAGVAVGILLVVVLIVIIKNK